MWPDRVSNPGPLTYESGALPTALRGPAPSVLSEYALACVSVSVTVRVSVSVSLLVGVFDQVNQC